MATLMNDRDVRLQATVPRNINPTAGKKLELLPDSLFFKVNNAGDNTPEIITFTATRTGLVGNVTFVVTGGTLAVAGNTATLDYDDMPGDTATVKVTLTENGQSYTSNIITVAKVRDGGSGTPGINNAIIYAYRRSATAPSGLPGAVAYDFTTALITTATLANSWSKTVPAGTDPLYVTAATASSTTSTAAVAAGAWSTAVVLAQNGGTGTNGLNSAPVLIYQRTASATAPALPSVATTYTFATGALSGLNNGWSSTVPSAGGAYLHVSTATASATTATDSIPAAEWAAVSLLAQDGSNGTPGLSTSVIYAYQRAATAPTLKPGAVTYTFASGTITTPATDALANGWTKTIPAGTNPLYVTVATASGTGATDTVADTEWATPVVLAQNGTNGSTGAAGLNSASVFIYQRNSTGVAPTLPSASTTYTFATGALSGLTNGWSTAVPANSVGEYLFVSVATAAATTATDAIAAGEWGAAQVMAKNGSTGLYPPLTDASWSANAPVQTVTDGKVGPTVRRSPAGTDTVFSQTVMFQIDRTRTYRTRFWARAAAGTNGSLYHTLQQFLSNGSAGPVNGGRSPYQPSNIAAHTDWREYSFTWTSVDWQTGVTQVMPDFLLNYSGTTGYWEVQDYDFRDVSEVVAAKAVADAAATQAALANAGVSVIADDNVLSRGEKSEVILKWATISGEFAGITAKADAEGVTRVAYTNATDSLNTYLLGLSPAYTDTATNTTIVGTTFRSMFASYYTERQALLNAIAAKAATTAGWSGVTGDGRPADNATVGGADAATSMGFNPQFSDWPTGQTLPTGWVGWSGNPQRQSQYVKTAPYAVGWEVLSAGATGMTKAVFFADHPLAVGTYLRGSFDAQILTNMGGTGKPGYLIRLYTNSSFTTYRDTTTSVLRNDVNGWQRKPFTANVVAGERIYGIQMWQMASGGEMDGGVWSLGSYVVFDNLTFDWVTPTTENQLSLNPFSVNVTGVMDTSVPNGTQHYGNKTATPVNGTAPFEYTWAVSDVSEGNVFSALTGSANVIGIYGTGTNSGTSARLSLTVKDAQGRVATYTTGVGSTHGSPP